MVWCDKPKMRASFFIGAMLALIGLGLYLMKYVVLGIIILIIGISVAMISYTILKFYVFNMGRIKKL